ncbi:B12 binding domain protein [uncultured archaeon]|nr:B12 binding domain protein [uncultured archaeon]
MKPILTITRNEKKPSINSKTQGGNTNYRILLIYPPSHTQQHNSCPMGIQMIAAVLENAGYQVSLLDANAAKKRYNLEEIVQIVHQLKPDIIGMTLLTSIVKEAYTLLSHLKSTNAKFIAGGPHATIMPEEVIHHGFDAVVLGEGEAIIEEAVKALLGQIPKDTVSGWVYKDDKGVPIHTKERPFITNLDDLPLPARHLVNPHNYGSRKNQNLHRNIFSSRGCPAKCAFCSGGLFGRKFRFRSAQNILDEIIYVYKTYHSKHFCFVDDAMMVDKNRIKQLCEKLIEYDLPISWSVMTRIDTINEELLTLLARAKCIQIDLGVESGDPQTLRKIHKPHTVEMVQKIIPMIAKFKIKPVVFFIFGFP